MGRDRYLLEVDSIEVWAIPQRATFQEARNACPSGWRLPTAHCSDLIRLGQADSQSSLRNNELQQLRDYGVFDVLALPDSWFWSSSSHLDGDEFGCYFSGRSGFVTYDLKALVGNVLCIRGLGSATH